MKRLLGRILTLIAVTAVTLTPIAVKADPSGYKHFYPITITDTSAANRSNVPVVIAGITGTDELNALRINASGTNTDMTDSTDGTGQSYMMDTAQTMVVVPYIPASGSVVYNLYMGTDATQTSFPLITGTGGYITTTDHANLEPGSVYQLDISGYIDTSYVATPKHLIEKVNAFTLAVDAAQQITATMYTGGTPSTLSVSATGVTSGEHDIRVTADGTNFKIFVDDMVTAEDTEAQVIDNPVTATFAPAGAGYTTNIENLNGAATNWQSQLTNDGSTSYVRTFTTPMKWDYYTGSANAIPATATITGVTGGSYAMRNAGTAYVAVGIRINNTNVESGEIGLSSTSYTAKEAALARPGGGSWVQSDFDSFEMAVGLRSPDSGTSVPQSTQTYTKVSYTYPYTSTVPDNASNWTIGGDNTYSYITSFNLTQGATERIHYEPAVMLTGTAVVNLASGGSYPGVITWGANSGLTVTVGALTVAPSVVTNGATNLAPTSATLQGTLQGMGDYDFISMSFEWGTTTSYGSVTSETTLTAAGTYALVITGLSSNTLYHYRAVSRVATTTGDIYWRGADRSFTTLLAEGSSTDIQVRGANIFNTYSATGDMLICIEAINKYSNYFPNERPGDYFQVQLLDSDNTTIIATNTLANWGDRPTSIYLKPTLAATLTAQGTYYIRMIGYGIVGTPYAEYTIVSDDWKGNNLSALDSWCIGTAKNMQINDEVNTYITTATDRTEILSDTVGAYFTSGIPGISTIRPNLFNTNVKSSTTGLGTAGDTWTDAAAWEAAVGTGIAADITKLAAPFGLDPQEMLEIVFWGVTIIIALYVVGNGQSSAKAIGAFFVAVPLLYVTTHLKVISPDTVIVLFIVAIVVFVVWFFSKVQ